MFRARIVLLGGRRAFDAVDCGDGRRDAAHGEPVARPLCARGAGRLGRQAAPRAEAEIRCREPQKRILAVLDRPPPAGFTRWTGPLIAAELGDVHEQQVWRVLRAHKLDLGGRKSWCESNDPDFVAKAADVVGLYVVPPENAIVICVDEKPSIQALERAQGYLKLPNGRALTGHSHDYKRHDTSTLFAAFEVATGKVTAAHTRSKGGASSSSTSWTRWLAPIRTRSFTSSSTTSTHTRRTKLGCSSIPRSSSTSPRPGRPGSTKSKSSSPSCRPSP